jgi:hypothetical protein
MNSDLRHALREFRKRPALTLTAVLSLALGIATTASPAHDSWQERAEYLEQLRAKIAALPQVEAATIASNAMPPSNGNDVRANFLGRSDLGAPEIRMNFVGPEYFSILRIPSSKAACGTTPKRCGPVPSPSSINRWPAVTGQTAMPSAIRFAPPI